MTAALATAASLAEALLRRHDTPEWWVAREVTLASRRLDFLAVNLWGARSYRVIGYEIKVSRGDWLRELGDWGKQEAWCRVVDDFYVVTPRKLVAPDELPVGWGLLELCGSGLRLRVHPAPSTPGATLPREVVARLIMRERERLRSERWSRDAEMRNDAEAKAEARWAQHLEREREANEVTRRDYEALLAALDLRPEEWGAQEKALRAAGIYAAHCDQWDALRADMNRRADRLAVAATTLRVAADACSA